MTDPVQAKTRWNRHRVTGSAIGAAGGGTTGYSVGGIGIAAMGSAIGIPVWGVVLVGAGLGAGAAYAGVRIWEKIRPKAAA